LEFVVVGRAQAAHPADDGCILGHRQVGHLGGVLLRPALSISAFSSGSTLRMVTGSTGWLRSMMPKLAANLTSGVPSPVRGLQGKDAGIDRYAAMSSANFAGSSMENSVTSGKGV